MRRDKTVFFGIFSDKILIERAKKILDKLVARGKPVVVYGYPSVYLPLIQGRKVPCINESITMIGKYGLGYTQFIATPFDMLEGELQRKASSNGVFSLNQDESDIIMGDRKPAADQRYPCHTNNLVEFAGEELIVRLKAKGFDFLTDNLSVRYHETRFLVKYHRLTIVCTDFTDDILDRVVKAIADYVGKSVPATYQFPSILDAVRYSGRQTLYTAFVHFRPIKAGCSVADGNTLNGCRFDTSFETGTLEYSQVCLMGGPLVPGEILKKAEEFASPAPNVVTTTERSPVTSPLNLSLIIRTPSLVASRIIDWRCQEERRLLFPRLTGNNDLTFKDVITVKEVKWDYPLRPEYRSMQPGSNLRRFMFLLSLIRSWPKGLILPLEVKQLVMYYVDRVLINDGLVVESPCNSWPDMLRLYDQDLKMVTTKSYGHLARSCTFGYMWIRFFQFINGVLSEICGRVNPDIALYVAVNVNLPDLCLRMSIESVGVWVPAKYQMDDIYVNKIAGPGFDSTFNSSDPGPWTFFRVSGWSASKCLRNLLWLTIVGSSIYGIRPFIFSNPTTVVSNVDFWFEDFNEICQVKYGRIKLYGYQSMFRSAIVFELMGGGTPHDMSDRISKSDQDPIIRLDWSEALLLESGRGKSVVYGDRLI
jgi:hypothetical protein